MFFLIFSIIFNLTIARLKYEGGGDWYNDPEIIPNLAKEINRRTSVKVEEKEEIITLLSENLYQYPFIFMTGHGNINFSEKEAKNLRDYLLNGGFLYADDDYGMDTAFRREIKKVFPDKELIELPIDFPIFHIFYSFNKLPKIHEHYEGSPKAFGIFHKKRLILLYTWNTNISDGWTDRYNDPPEKREEAIRMGINIFLYALSQ
ncbi:MAG: DUF4159 domain-containing protein [candidate division WOR-3 bacterium]|nr:DUF4159 domain-containing protein [candidate division WOR-3 bacterium]MCX7836516.1 DUF4159 domain-containing protein [candidate division WOR-3 bacterium]MDW8113754.1 DUF4159 domain-containing protein [candidate division WOR-3 bacterium]